MYASPLLETLDNADLGVWIGPINCGISCVADDVYLNADNQYNLQGLLDIANHYGNMFRVKYGASKTKITVSGSQTDQQFYKEVNSWTLDGQKISVTENNEHLGQIVSGVNQEMMNVDERLKKGRQSIFSLLGPAFSFKCLLSPQVKLHLYRTYTCPITRSGLSSFVLRPTHMEPLKLFQRKILKGILHFSMSAPTPSIHFLCSELPIEGKIHKDMFSLFYSVWNNPNSKIYQIVKYLIQMSSEKSRTWSNHIKYLSEMYKMEDPLICLNRDAPE